MQFNNPLTLHRVAFWIGTLSILIGVAFHLPDFVGQKEMHFQMSGMPMSGLMLAGMTLISLGVCATAYGLFPVRSAAVDASTQFQLHALDDARLTAKHWQLVAVLGIALVVDVMKPATLGFVVPGMRREYQISASEAALLALFAMIGTTIGSIVWGVLADRLGRRGSILLASLLFISTGICGAMPFYKWNLLMCLIMGMSAGGMLPIVFALLAEIVPARHRGWLSVLVGGLGTSGGYLAASGAAAWLEPMYSWRILWLLNVPTGLLVIVLSRFIPESPRFLLHEGRIAEACRMLATFGIELLRAPDKEHSAEAAVMHSRDVRQLLRRPYLQLTSAVCLYGVAWGLVNWGFLTWLPSILRDFLQLDGKIANRLLAQAALISVPGCILVAWLYGVWSSKKTMILFALATAATLAAFAPVKSASGPGRELVLSLLIVLLLVGLSGMIAMLSPYSVELYPTRLRGTGGGLVAASSKVGGIVGPSAVAFILTVSPGLTVPALVLAVPLIIAAITLAKSGRETRGKRLDEIV